MENIKKILEWLKPKPLWAKIIVIVVIIAISVLFLCSCGTLSQSLPSIKENQVGAEGVISKEKNVTRQTKWFFRPDVDTTINNTN